MKNSVLIMSFLTAALMSVQRLHTQDQTQDSVRPFYEKSLHYTNRGLEYWYTKENGGLERLTGIPFSQLSCSGCHVRTCDTCHASVVSGKPEYSLESAKAETACKKCHAPGDKTADVHFERGMRCMGCHTTREIHGDGTAYVSMHAPGAMDTGCEKCHSDLSKCPSNAVHKGKVDCSACHVRDVSSCYNCHFDTKVSQKKSVSLPLKNMMFLINHDDKVTLANLHTFVYRNRTMIVFAPAFSHTIMKEGRKCAECHATRLLAAMKAGIFKPVVWENDSLKNSAGIVPVLDGYDWDFVYLNYINGKWVRIEKPPKPLLNYSGYAQPITSEQFAKLMTPQE